MWYPGLLRARDQLGVGRHVVQRVGAGLELVERALAHEVDHIAGRSVDEIPDGVVRGGEHALHVLQREEEHESNGQHGIVGGAHVDHVVVHLVGHEPEFLEHQRPRHFLEARGSRSRPVPAKRVQAIRRGPARTWRVRTPPVG